MWIKRDKKIESLFNFQKKIGLQRYIAYLCGSILKMSSFSELGLSDRLLANIQRLGYENPTPIQEQAIPQLVTGTRDMIALAQTGTGKTATFGLPLVDLIDVKEDYVQALILAPTRELCVQISNDLKSYTKGVKDIEVVPVYGGANISEQIKSIRRKCHIIAATPGRLIDLLSRDVVNISAIKYFILDEADEMLNMGFQEDIDEILKHTSTEKRVWLFSATMPKEIERIAKNYMSNPLEIAVGNKNSGNENITHQFTVVHGSDRYKALKRIIDYHYDIYGLIFCRTKIETQEIADQLLADGYNADSLHGDLSQAQRDKVLNNFRKRSLQLLVATDVAARGIDVSDVTHVINYHLPDELEYYTHRSGRTARAGKTGISIAIVSPKDQFKVSQMERQLKLSFERIKVPTGREICGQKMKAMIGELQKVVVNEAEIDSYIPQLIKATEHLEREDLIKRFASLEFNHFLDYYRDSYDINISSDSRSRDRRSDGDYSTRRGDRNDRGGSRTDRNGHSGDRGGYVGDRGGDRSGPVGSRLFINIGKKDGLDIHSFLNLVSANTGIPKKDINRVELSGVYTHFDVETGMGDKVIKKMNGGWYGDRQIRIESAAEMPSKLGKRTDDRKDHFRKKDKDKDKKRKH